MRRKKAIVFGGCILLMTVLNVSACAAEELSKEKIIEIATGKVVGLGYNLKAMDMVYDEYNQRFKEHFKQESIEAESYQVVLFKSKQVAAGSDLWVVVNRKDGSVKFFGSNVDLLRKQLVLLNLDNPESDLEKHLLSRDKNPVCVYGYAVDCPGWSGSNIQGPRMIEGTSDYVENEEHENLIDRARSYALRYNAALSKRLITDESNT